MENYLKKTATGFEFNSNKFLEVQHKIASKYDNNEDYDVIKFGLIKVAKRMDNFYARINGEIAEVYRELLFKNDWNKEELIKETADIIMYLGSQNYITDYNLHLLDKDFDGDYDFSFPHKIQTFDTKALQNLYIFRIIARIQELCTRMIDKYPVEWHEKVPEHSQIGLLLIFEDTRKIMLDLFQYAIMLMVQFADGNVDLINRLIHAKQQRALGRTGTRFELTKENNPDFLEYFDSIEHVRENLQMTLKLVFEDRITDDKELLKDDFLHFPLRDFNAIPEMSFDVLKELYHRIGDFVLKRM
jgi:hypothetical protein